MTALQIIFLITGIVTLGAGLMVVTTSNLVHAALWLVLSLFGVAVVYVLLNASFLAVAQVVIYIGAIAILMIFAIMLTRRLAGPERGPQTTRNWGWAAVLAVGMFAVLAWILNSWPGVNTNLPELTADPLSALGQALVSPNAYVLPFELASIMLLAALVGAIFIAWERK